MSDSYCCMYGIPLLVLTVVGAHSSFSEQPRGDAPLPDPSELKHRVLENERKSAQQKEKYLCEVTDETEELDSGGAVKKKETKISEQFFVNRRQIDHLLSKNGKTLTGAAEKKEQDRVEKEVQKYTDLRTAKKAEDEQEKQLEMVMQAIRYTNGHRELRDGRSTVVYDIAGDQNFHPNSIEQRFAKALTGRIWIDEASGEMVELRVRTQQDVKVAGGLFANLHKGFQFHLRQVRQPDGVWMTNLAEGSGDARAGLFFHPRFRFRQSKGNCRLYSVDTATHTEPPAETR